MSDSDPYRWRPLPRWASILLAILVSAIVAMVIRILAELILGCVNNENFWWFAVPFTITLTALIILKQPRRFRKDPDSWSSV
jgi:hypothetical protein